MVETHRFGRFQTTRPINDDESVFEALDGETGESCILKIARRSSLSAIGKGNPSQNTNVLAYEAAALRRWNGIPGVVRLLQWSPDPPTPHLVLEKLGTDLDNSVDENGLPLSASLSVIRDVARALESIHERGEAHNDIKPENILWSDRTKRWTLIDPSPPEVATHDYLGANLRGTARDLCALGRVFVTTYLGFQETIFGNEYAKVIEEHENGGRWVRTLRRLLKNGTPSAHATRLAAETLLTELQRE